MSETIKSPLIIEPRGSARQMKPVGSHPVDINGITLRQSTEVPEGMQALYDGNGQILWVGAIGTNPDTIKGRSITLNPKDYEIALRSHMDASMRNRKQRFKH